MYRPIYSSRHVGSPDKKPLNKWDQKPNNWPAFLAIVIVAVIFLLAIFLS